MSNDTSSARAADNVGSAQSQHRFVYDGALGTVYRIWLLNLVLSVITLGIYSFWGRTRIRRYSAASFALGGDRLEYTGTGKELWKGFLKAAPLILALYLPLAIFPLDQYPATSVMFVPIIYFVYVGLFAATRYRLSRTLWRGIRGRLTGSAFKYGALGLGTMLLNVVSLGAMIPWSDRVITRYLMANVWFGDCQATFADRADGLWRVHFLTILAGLAPACLMTAGVFALGGSGWTSLPLFVIASLAVTRLWYRAALIRYQFTNLRVNTLRFAADQTGVQQAKLMVGNFLIFLLTLGIGQPFILQRGFAFLARHLSLSGDLDAAAAQIRQSQEALSTSGEGLDAFVGSDSSIL